MTLKELLRIAKRDGHVTARGVDYFAQFEEGKYLGNDFDAVCLTTHIYVKDGDLEFWDEPGVQNFLDDLRVKRMRRRSKKEEQREREKEAEKKAARERFLQESIERDLLQFRPEDRETIRRMMDGGSRKGE
jgi:hypothetical protein